MLKKLLSLILALALVFTFVACDSKERDYDDEDEEEEKTTETEKEETEEEEEEFTFEETTVVDDDNYTITIKSIDPEGEWGYTVNAFFENKTDEKLNYSIEYASINEVMCDPFFSLDLNGGKKSNEEIVFDEGDLKELGIEDITSIFLLFRIYEEETFSCLFEKDVTLYPMGEDAAEPHKHQAAEGQITVLDNDTCTIIIEGTEEDYVWGYGVRVYFHNKTDTKLDLYVNQSSLNDYELDGWGTLIVAPGMHAYGYIYWWQDDLDVQGIEEVESIWLELLVDDWSTYETVYELDIEFAPF